MYLRDRIVWPRMRYQRVLGDIWPADSASFSMIAKARLPITVVPLVPGVHAEKASSSKTPASSINGAPRRHGQTSACRPSRTTVSQLAAFPAAVDPVRNLSILQSPRRPSHIEDPGALRALYHRLNAEPDRQLPPPRHLRWAIAAAGSSTPFRGMRTGAGISYFRLTRLKRA